MPLIIGDIAGRFDELLLLIEKMPKDKEIILIGDLIDRGKKSRQVIEFAMSNKNVKTIRGNHEDMLVDFIRDTKFYQPGLWFYNGGWDTMKSYGAEENTYNFSDRCSFIPKEHVEWIESLPLYIETDTHFISHAPMNWWLGLERACDIRDNRNLTTNIIWNRNWPSKKDKFQIFGHNGKLKKVNDYAICIDDSHNDKLTGYDTETGEIYQQEYLK